MAKQKPITWKSIKVVANCINPTANNYKIKSDLGKQRLQTSLGKFGRAGTVVCNYAKQKGKYDLIDGNSRWEDQMVKNPKGVMEISVPSRPLTKLEYEEMSAIFDFAVAGSVDLDRIKSEKGSTKDFFERWNLEVPMELLNNLGAKAKKVDVVYPDKNKGGEETAIPVTDIKMVQLFFSVKQEAEFRKLEEKLMKRFKTSNTTDTVLKAIRSIK